MPGETVTGSPDTRCPVRRSGRQPKRTDKLEEFLSTAKRGLRKSAPPSGESGDPPSQTPTDAETASEASFDGSVEFKAAEDKTDSPERKTRSATKKQAQKKPQRGMQTRRSGRAAVKDEGSSENEEENKDEIKNDPDQGEGNKDKKSDPDVAESNNATQPQQDHDSKNEEKPEPEVKNEKMEESEDKPAPLTERSGPLRTYVNKKRAAKKNSPPVRVVVNKNSAPIKPKTTVKMGKPQIEEDEDDDSSSSSSSLEESDGDYDPNALYCICRQKHNKRFMICCDRCEEWFHGDCVGITEVRGRLLERNGEDYICPNCTAKKNQLATAPSSSTASGAEEKSSEDLGIKGRIEKATNPTGKKKIKIFQPAVQLAVQPKAEQKASPAAETKASVEQKASPDSEHKVASVVEVKTSPEVEVAEDKSGQKAEDDTSSPKCIGPGCAKNAQPDSVYCGHDCILRHAAATMKSISDVKEPKDKAPITKSTAKVSSAAGRRTRRKTQEESDSEESNSPDPDEDDEDEHAEEHPPSPATASWSSDHNYIAVTPEKTTPISPTVLNKKSPPKEEKQAVKEATPSSEKSSSASTTQSKSKAKNKSPTRKAAKVSPKGKKPSNPPGDSKTSKKPAAPPNKTSSQTKKSSSSSTPAPSPFPQGPIHVTGALRVTKTNFTIPKKQPQKDFSSLSPSPSSSSRTASASSTPPSQSSSRSAHPPAPVSPMRPPPNTQMRQNIRRSLTDILFKRVSNSDDLKMTESEVGRLAFAIEKEMFNLCLSTDSKYKNKYRTLMLHLKDPKNKGLFYRVIGGEVTPFRLVRLSAEELVSREMSEWRRRDAPESHSARAQSGQTRQGNRHDPGSHSTDMEDAPPTSDADVCISANTSASRMSSAAEQDESASAPAQSSAIDSSGDNVTDVFSSMLKDTTSEHRTHLFDLNCKICTGMKAEEEPAAKKAKLIKKPDTKPPRPESLPSRAADASPITQTQSSPSYQQHQGSTTFPSHPSILEPAVSEPQLSVYQEDPSLMAPPVQAPPTVAPAVSSVSISRRDPRVARHASVVNLPQAGPEKPNMIVVEPLPAPVAALMEAGVKSLLPMPPAPLAPPAPPALVTVPKPSKTSTTEPPPEGETAIFLHGQEKLWKGFINMQSVAKFVTKAYLVSGSGEHLKEDLPDTIHVGGRIPPGTVWDYVGKLKTSLSKELCLIRFHPATEEEEVAYVSLFSYFSSRKRFGVVANNRGRIKDLYLIPLSSNDPLPSKLLPFDGPGLEPARPNLLLGLLICQKDRKRAGAQLESEDKRSKIQTKEVDETGLPKLPAPLRADKSTRQSLEASFSTTPPGSPPSNSSETPGSAASTVLPFQLPVKAPAPSTAVGPVPLSSSAATSTAVTNPLQTLLNTLFRKKKHDSDASNSPSDQAAELPQSSTMSDPIVQQFAQKPKENLLEVDEDDRPYDPEEEYDPSMGYNLPKKPVELVKPEVSKEPEVVASESDDVAYDPEDDSIFDEVKTLVPGQTQTAVPCVADPQKIIENLKRIGDQALLKSDQKASITVPSAPVAQVASPVESILASSQLLQLGKKVEELVKSSSVTPLINQKRDPRQSRDPRYTADDNVLDQSEEKEDEAVPLTESIPPSKPVEQESPQQHAAEAADTSQSQAASLLQEEKDDPMSFTPPSKEEVTIPLLGEKIDPDVEVSYMGDEEVQSEEEHTSSVEAEVDKYSLWPNAASILKSGEDDQNSQNSFHNEFAETSIVTSTIPVLTQSTLMADSHPRHTGHRMPSFDDDYSPGADIPPQSNFPASHSMQGQNLIMRPPPVSVMPSMQAPSPMPGHPPMHGPPLHLHAPPACTQSFHDAGRKSTVRSTPRFLPPLPEPVARTAPSWTPPTEHPSSQRATPTIPCSHTERSPTTNV
ncbi:hypothetical protein OJAV_G00042050 [Oryzias javanicus]|uniref:Death-inducer obliterator 1 n=1 Tax=Oryzias javanicus TaxID=123683 RepID=A0A3S2PFP3_ORYJA|nr:hypothetical protein OJAV_G00042050 [Oryzias javanicus]